MSELACTCVTCKLELINTCRCDFAAKMRGEVLAQLDGLDLSTEATRHAAAEAVRASFVARYGPKVLDRTNRFDPNGRIVGFVVAAILLLFFVVILLGRRSIRRRARPDR
jgi:cytochrome c-type biogenesis protein CcmH/NrfF